MAEGPALKRRRGVEDDEDDDGAAPPASPQQGVPEPPAPAAAQQQQQPCGTSEAEDDSSQRSAAGGPAPPESGEPQDTQSGPPQGGGDAQPAPDAGEPPAVDAEAPLQPAPSEGAACPPQSAAGERDASPSPSPAAGPTEAPSPPSAPQPQPGERGCSPPHGLPGLALLSRSAPSAQLGGLAALRSVAEETAYRVFKPLEGPIRCRYSQGGKITGAAEGGAAYAAGLRSGMVICSIAGHPVGPHSMVEDVARLFSAVPPGTEFTVIARPAGKEPELAAKRVRADDAQAPPSPRKERPPDTHAAMATAAAAKRRRREEDNAALRAEGLGFEDLFGDLYAAGDAAALFPRKGHQVLAEHADLLRETLAKQVAFAEEQERYDALLREAFGDEGMADTEQAKRVARVPSSGQLADAPPVHAVSHQVFPPAAARVNPHAARGLVRPTLRSYITAMPVMANLQCLHFALDHKGEIPRLDVATRGEKTGQYAHRTPPDRQPLKSGHLGAGATHPGAIYSPINVIRWRQEEDGRIRSNARVLEYANGDTVLRVGSDYFKLDRDDAAGENQHLFGRHVGGSAQVCRHHFRLRGRVNMRPLRTAHGVKNSSMQEMELKVREDRAEVVAGRQREIKFLARPPNEQYHKAMEHSRKLKHQQMKREVCRMRGVPYVAADSDSEDSVEAKKATERRKKRLLKAEQHMLQWMERCREGFPGGCLNDVAIQACEDATPPRDTWVDTNWDALPVPDAIKEEWCKAWEERCRFEVRSLLLLLPRELRGADRIIAEAGRAALRANIPGSEWARKGLPIELQRMRQRLPPKFIMHMRLTVAAAAATAAALCATAAGLGPAPRQAGRKRQHSPDVGPTATRRKLLTPSPARSGSPEPESVTVPRQSSATSAQPAAAAPAAAATAAGGPHAGMRRWLARCMKGFPSNQLPSRARRLLDKEVPKRDLWPTIDWDRLPVPDSIVKAWWSSYEDRVLAALPPYLVTEWEKQKIRDGLSSVDNLARKHQTLLIRARASRLGARPIPLAVLEFQTQKEEILGKAVARWRLTGRLPYLHDRYAYVAAAVAILHIYAVAPGAPARGGPRARSPSPGPRPSTAARRGLRTPSPARFASRIEEVVLFPAWFDHPAEDSDSGEWDFDDRLAGDAVFAAGVSACVAALARLAASVAPKRRKQR
eukprot:TRINITY_DN2174_c1_g1_i3.p1 TRINITY_DN2174_c1_g1~~TRINITY_DN2174_c1_g1_i3.p1  ORF type:complete len:1170 (+),score=280.98 TRINITY_DN2174_c1_g1_i3:116-3625(+)